MSTDLAFEDTNASAATIRFFGAATFVALLGAYAFYAFWFISVWCFFAAFLSAIVVVHFSHRNADPALLI